MAKKTLKDITKTMKKLDICMMTTGSGKNLESRPMSNNSDVDYDGNSYFFTDGKSNVAKDLKKNAAVNLAFSGKKDLYVSVAGKAKLIKDKKKMAAHWVPDLEIWFKDGLDTKGITMIHVAAKKIKLWEDMNEVEVKI